MTILTQENWDSQTNGATPTFPSGWSTSGSPGGLVSSAAALDGHGNRGVECASTAESGRYQWDSGANRSGLTVIDVYFRVTSWSSGNMYFLNSYSLTSGGVPVGDIRINPSTHTLTLRDGNAATGGNPGSPTPLDLSTWYRQALGFNPTTNTLEGRTYIGESDVPFITISGSLTSDLARVFTFGPSAAAAGGAIQFNSIRIADEWLGPINPSAPAGEAPSEWIREGGVWRPYIEDLL